MITFKISRATKYEIKTTNAENIIFIKIITLTTTTKIINIINIIIMIHSNL